MPPSIASPNRFFPQNVLTVYCIESVFARWHCSNLHVLSQPSRLFVLLSSHCSVPARTPSPHTMLRHVAEHVAVFGGSHCSFVLGLTKPSPHIEVTHT